MHLSLSPLGTDLGISLPSRLPDTVDTALALAPLLSERLAVASAHDRWSTLATLAAHDLSVARAIEPHLDAMGILAEADIRDSHGTWGVFAAEGGDDPLIASPVDDGFTLSGTKVWCSLAGGLDHALITATTADGDRMLFHVDLRQPGVEVLEGAWVARGLVDIPSGPVRFASVPAIAVGDAGWYLRRPGFAWGGIGVAACWYGGAVGVARTVFAAASTRPNPHLLSHLGAIDVALHDSRRALSEAATALDGASDVNPRLMAKRVRSTVAQACEQILFRAGHALGPAPLALDEEHARRVADLQLYVRQHHAERDLESLGSALVESGAVPW